MNILIAGSSGFIGSALRKHLLSSGHTVCRLVRQESSVAQDEIAWNPARQNLPTDKLAVFDAVVNLCGENLLGLWTLAKKRRIYSSRIDTTAFLASAIAASRPRPPIFVCASAIGFYGSRGDEILTEQSPQGKGFLAGVCLDWEKAAAPESLTGVRIVNLRLGMVLDPSGGALAKMLPPFKMGLGGPLGDGTHWQSWISLTDCVRAIEFALLTASLSGPVNAVSPQPMRNIDFTRLLADVLGKPAKLKTPAGILRLLPGGFADEVLLSSIRAIPQKLLNAGFTFHYPSLCEFFKSCLR